MIIGVSHPAFKTQRLAVKPGGLFRGSKLLINGLPAQKFKGLYSIPSDSGVTTPIQLKYVPLDPIPKIEIGSELIELARPLKWYEYLWIGIPIILIFEGGALGGVLGIFAAYSSGHVFRSDRSALKRYGLTAMIAIGTFMAYLVLEFLIRSITRK